MLCSIILIIFQRFLAFISIFGETIKLSQIFDKNRLYKYVGRRICPIEKLTCGTPNYLICYLPRNRGKYTS